MVILKSLRDIEKMRESGKIVAATLSLLKENAIPGITTLELNNIAENFILKNKAIPSFKGYLGFPFSICSSINDEVIHGMPSLYKLKEGDVISIDVGALKNDFHGDSSITFGVGNISKEAESLIKTGQECLYTGIKSAIANNRIGNISKSIQELAESRKYGVVKKFVGHGIGRNLHEPPKIANYLEEGYTDLGLLIKPGMTLAIEPMITAGSNSVSIMSNNWTVVTDDGKLAVHWEHTILVTENDPEILTLREDEE
jgi:methionyl aminopeptidase